jgi:hypothetical protein
MQQGIKVFWFFSSEKNKKERLFFFLKKKKQYCDRLKIRQIASGGQRLCLCTPPGASRPWTVLTRVYLPE